MQIIFEVKLQAAVKKKKGCFVSCCPILDVYAQGDTKVKALKNLTEALSLFLTSCHRRGTLDEVLKACGFVPFTKRHVMPKPFPDKYDTVNVPVPYMTKHKGGTDKCHA